MRSEPFRSLAGVQRPTHQCSCRYTRCVRLQPVERFIQPRFDVERAGIIYNHRRNGAAIVCESAEISFGFAIVDPNLPVLSIRNVEHIATRCQRARAERSERFRQLAKRLSIGIEAQYGIRMVVRDIENILTVNCHAERRFKLRLVCHLRVIRLIRRAPPVEAQNTIEATIQYIDAILAVSSQPDRLLQRLFQDCAQFQLRQAKDHDLAGAAVGNVKAVIGDEQTTRLIELSQSDSTATSARDDHSRLATAIVADHALIAGVGYIDILAISNRQAGRLWIEWPWKRDRLTICCARNASQHKRAVALRLQPGSCYRLPVPMIAQYGVSFL